MMKAWCWKCLYGFTLLERIKLSLVSFSKCPKCGCELHWLQETKSPYRGIRAVAMPLAILLGTITTMIVFMVFIILTPFWNSYANQLTNFINSQIAHVPSLSLAQSNIATLTTQWAIMFFVSFITGGIVVYLSAYHSEPDPYAGGDFGDEQY